MRKNLPAVLVIIAFVVGGFAVLDHYKVNEGQARWEGTVVVDPTNLSDADKEGIRSFGIPVEFSVEGSSVQFVKGPTRSEYVEGFGTLYVQAVTNKEMSNQHYFTGCTITLSNNAEPITDSEWGTVIVHEFGHCLGLQHNDAEMSIMGTVMDEGKFTPFVTSADKKAIAARYGN